MGAEMQRRHEPPPVGPCCSSRSHLPHRSRTIRWCHRITVYHS